VNFNSIVATPDEVDLPEPELEAASTAPQPPAAPTNNWSILSPPQGGKYDPLGKYSDEVRII
jgi:hypothetical protein